VSRDCYRAIFEALRSEPGYADYLGAMSNPQLMPMSSYLVDYLFADRLYPGALDVIAHFRQRGLTVILTDRDVVFQPRKVHCAGLWQAVEGRVLIYVHPVYVYMEQMFDDLQQRYPAHRYVMVDDKQRILSAMKNLVRERLTTVFPRQGHYSLDPHNRDLSDCRPHDRAQRRSARLRTVRAARTRHGRLKEQRKRHERYTTTLRSWPEPLA
jgi:hypothetical protein